MKLPLLLCLLLVLAPLLSSAHRVDRTTGLVYTQPPTPRGMRNEIYLYATDFEARGGNVQDVCETADPPMEGCRAHMSFLSYYKRRLSQLPRLFQFSPLSPVFGYSRLTNDAEFMGSWETIIFQQVIRKSLAEMGVLPPHTGFWTKNGCKNWATNKRGYTGSVGYSSYRTKQWLSNGNSRCSNKQKWLCMCLKDVFPTISTGGDGVELSDYEMYTNDTIR